MIIITVAIELLLGGLGVRFLYDAFVVLPAVAARFREMGLAPSPLATLPGSLLFVALGFIYLLYAALLVSKQRQGGVPAWMVMIGALMVLASALSFIVQATIANSAVVGLLRTATTGTP